MSSEIESVKISVKKNHFEFRISINYQPITMLEYVQPENIEIEVIAVALHDDYPVFHEGDWSNVSGIPLFLSWGIWQIAQIAKYTIRKSDLNWLLRSLIFIDNRYIENKLYDNCLEKPWNHAESKENDQ